MSSPILPPENIEGAFGLVMVVVALGALSTVVIMTIVLPLGRRITAAVRWGMRRRKPAIPPARIARRSP